MSLLTEIQTAAIDGSADLGTLLRKCRLLAARLGSNELAQWIRNESSGYEDEKEVPRYRCISLHFKGHFLGPFGSSMQNAVIPPYLIAQFIGKEHLEHKNTQSAASIEAMLKAQENSEGQTLRVPFANWALLLTGKVFPTYSCVSVWGELPPSFLADVQNAVRNRILEYALEIEKNDPKAGEVAGGQSTTISGTTLTQIFNTTIHGGSANVVGTANNSTVAINNAAGNFEDLRRVLHQAGVDEKDITAAERAISDDQPPSSASDGFGKKVAGWIKGMLGKAADGSWKVGLGAAGKLLEEALLRYYGLKS